MFGRRWKKKATGTTTRTTSKAAAEDDNDDGGGGESWSSDEGKEMNLGRRSDLQSTIDQIDVDFAAAAATPAAATTAGTVLGNANAIRPEEQVIDSTAYYNILSLMCAVYIRTEQGIKLPIVFDERAQRMVRSNKKARFDF